MDGNCGRGCNIRWSNYRRNIKCFGNKDLNEFSEGKWQTAKVTSERILQKILDVLPVTELMEVQIEDQEKAPRGKSVRLMVKRLIVPAVHPVVLMMGEPGW